MDKPNIPKWALLMVFLVLNPKMEGQAVPFPPFAPRPLCNFQIALANQACAFLPVTPMPPSPPSPPAPTPPTPPPDDHGHGHGHGHRHGHEHGHHDHSESPIEEECCKWLAQVDEECVCDLLVRLPPFLAKPSHQYTLLVDESCNITYHCGGRLKP